MVEEKRKREGKTEKERKEEEKRAWEDGCGGRNKGKGGKEEESKGRRWPEEPAEMEEGQGGDSRRFPTLRGKSGEPRIPPVAAIFFLQTRGFFEFDEIHAISIT